MFMTKSHEIINTIYQVSRIHEVYQCQWIFNNTSTDCTKQYIVYYGLGHCSNKAITTMTCSY